MKQQIIEFFNSRKTDAAIKLNDFIKTLYPKPTVENPAKFLTQAESKKIRLVLEELVSEGHLSIHGNKHQILGKSYYEGEGQLQKHFNLSNVELWAEK